MSEESEGPASAPPAWHRRDSVSRRVAVELLILAFVYFAYRFGQGLVSDAYGQAERNAMALIGLEKGLHVYFEPSWHQWVLARSFLMDAFSWYYANMHFGTTLAAMVLVFVFAHGRYRDTRNAWVLFTVSAFLIQWAVPMMPPRLLPHLGYVDVSASGVGGIYAPDELGPLTNQIAAMPSIHFGWSLFAAIAVQRVSPHWTTRLAFLHPVMTVFTITATANHFILDAVASAPLLAAAFYVAPRLPRLPARWAPHRARHPERLPPLDDRLVAGARRVLAHRWALPALSAAAFGVALLLSWNWFDVDEFANLQQALALADGGSLYTDVPLHHPPLYVASVLALAAMLPGPALVWARLFSLALAWGAGLLAADLLRRHGRPRAAAAFLGLWSLSAFVLLAGTRAMNEVPALFLLVLAAWAYLGPLRDRAAGAAAGALLAAALLTRFTSVFFFAPFLLLRPRALPWALGAGIAALSAAAALAAWLDPAALSGLWQQAVVFQGSRPPLPRLLVLGEAILGSGLLVLVVAWLMVPAVRPRTGRWGAALALLTAAVLAMAALPRMSLHYFLPAAPAVVAVVAFVLTEPDVRRQARRACTGALLVTSLAMASIYIAATPHHDLDDAEAIAGWVRANTPPDALVLTDAPEYAILADRENWNAYFWNLRGAYTAEGLSAALPEVSVVVASERLDEGTAFPAGFEARLEGLPCTRLDTVRIYWTGSDPPPGMTGCP